MKRCTQCALPKEVEEFFRNCNSRDGLTAACKRCFSKRQAARRERNRGRKIAVDESSFWRRVSKTGSCWLWTGVRNAEGYGRFAVGGWLKMAHRIAWQLTRCEIPEGMFVCHRCDNPSCVNPAHLFLGTDGDNTRDMVSKGRQWLQVDSSARRGESNPTAKLSDAEVAEIRAYVAAHGRGAQASMARKFGVQSGHVSRICSRKQRNQ